MIRREKEGIAWLEFELFKPYPEVVHGIFLRHGGFSEGAFSSLNFGRHQGDADDHVTRNIAKAKQALGVQELAWVNQVHGSIVRPVTGPGFAGEGDAMATDRGEIGLVVKHADCQAALFYDPVCRVIANVHSGWRGSVQNIYLRTVEHLREHFGVDPANLRVGISPSLGPQDAQFINYRTELPEAFWRYQVKPEHFDFWAISRQQLMDAGVPPNQIQIAEISTLSCPEDYFSYRREKASGRHGTFICLRDRVVGRQ